MNQFVDRCDDTESLELSLLKSLTENSPDSLINKHSDNCKLELDDTVYFMLKNLQFSARQKCFIN
jgi:hypothetical protein